MASEKFEVTAKPATAQSFNEFMEGDRNSAGGQHDLEDRGMGSGTHQELPRSLHSDDFTPPTDQPFVQDTATPLEPVQDFQQMYGQEANEKGQWRKTATEAMEELNQTKAELAALRQAAAVPGYPQTPQYAPQYQAPQPAQSTQSLPETFFPDKGEGDLVEVKDVDAMLRNLVAPAVFQLETQTRALQAQQLQAMKQAAGLNPSVEQRLLTNYAWLQGVPDGPPRIQAMQSVLQQEQAAKQQQPVQAPTQPAQNANAQGATRRITYVESGQQGQAESEVPLQQRIQQEFAQARTALEKKRVLQKYGMDAVNDFGPEYAGMVRR